VAEEHIELDIFGAEGVVDVAAVYDKRLKALRYEVDRGNLWVARAGRLR
jgi:hypothetical protein